MPGGVLLRREEDKMKERGRTQAANYAGIDDFRILAAVMVTAIHTAPFSGVSESLDTLLTYCVGRVAVPFFLMTTGFFVLGSWKKSGYADNGKVIRFIKKTLFLYAVSMVLYLPVNFYSGELPRSAGEFIRMIIFDGTFYHLWYFPAVILGCLVIMALLRYFSDRAVLVITVLLYLIGTGGDSYFGLVSRIPVLKAVYEAIFTVSSYTRNGIFYAPVFLFMGMMIREKMENSKEHTAGGRRWKSGDIAGLVVSLALMLGESYLTFRMDLQRHNSMYLFLIPAMYFLFRLLLIVPGKAPAWTRNISMIVYVIHPAVLIVLRGFAGAAGMTSLLVENALVQFISVALLSFVLAALLDRMYTRLCRRKEAHENG